MFQWRSLLFVPADNPDRCAKAAVAGADAVILDLEDAVAAHNKPAARAALAAAAELVRAGGSAVVVRINSAWLAAVEDLRVAVAAGANAVVVPKVEDPASLIVLAQICAELGANVPLIALIENPRGLREAAAIAALPCVAGLALGTEDFSLSVGLTPGGALLDLPARQIALAAAEAGNMALAVPFPIARFREEEAYRAACAGSAAYGVNGAICIHPRQVAIANAVFGVSEDELAQAVRILAAWDAAQAQGLSVVELDGGMIDLPVAARAKKLLARAVQDQT